MRILCGLCAKGQKFVHIRLRRKVPECVQNNEDSFAQIRKIITRQLQKINFHLIVEIP
jgi:hypothetical protein